jgi:IstB-like ATP binding protein
MSIVDPALRDSLRRLKLSGMLHTLDARLAQAQAGELGHLEFLQVLCHDEIGRRENMAIQRRLRRARFDQTSTLEEFDFAASPKLPAAQIRDLAALRWLQAGESVVLHGPVGVGKTHVAQALGHLAVRRGADVRFTKTSRVLTDLAGGHADRMAQTPRRTRPPRSADPRRLRHAWADRPTGRRPLRAHLRTRPGRQIPNRNLEPGPGRLVSAVPQPRRRRVTPRPAHQHQPPSLHERPQLPTQQATRPGRLDNQPGGQVEHHPRTTPWGIT